MDVELDWSVYAAKGDLTNATDVDISKFTKSNELVRLKSETDQLDISKLETTPFYLSKPSDVLKTKLLKRLYMMN